MSTRSRTTVLVLAVSLSGLVWTGVLLAAHGEGGCAQCHVPHNAYTEDAGVPLWNPSHTTTTLVEFNSGSGGSGGFSAIGSQIEGASILCLSCHDGTRTDQDHSFGTGTAGMGVLTASHPVSVVYEETWMYVTGQLKDAGTLDPGVLDGNGMVGCQSCHDVHESGQADSNLRWPYHDYEGASADFCNHCHNK